MSTLVTQSRIASLMASLRVRLPACTGHDLGAEQAHPGHVERLPPGVLLAHVDDALEAEQRAAVAVATPCWPAPVSAMTRVLPIARVSSACPSTLLILCEPVWLRSSRLSRTRAPPACSPNRRASVSGLGRPVYVASSPAELGLERGSAGPSRTPRSARPARPSAPRGRTARRTGRSGRRVEASAWCRSRPSGRACLMAGCAPRRRPGRPPPSAGRVRSPASRRPAPRRRRRGRSR